MSEMRRIRQEQGMTLATISRKVGVSIAYLSDIEKGNRRGSPAVIGRIADSLGVSVAELVGGA